MKWLNTRASHVTGYWFRFSATVESTRSRLVYSLGKTNPSLGFRDKFGIDSNFELFEWQPQNKAMRMVSTVKLLLLFVLVAALRPVPCIAKNCHEEYPWLTINCQGEQVSEPCWDECVRRRPNRVRASCLSWGRLGLPQTFCSCTFPCR